VAGGEAAQFTAAVRRGGVDVEGAAFAQVGGERVEEAGQDRPQ
jgi:hypothetical protein